MQRELHPTLLSSLEGIVDQMVWFRENWHEEVRKLKELVLYVSDFVAMCTFLTDQVVREKYSCCENLRASMVCTSCVYGCHANQVTTV